MPLLYRLFGKMQMDRGEPKRGALNYLSVYDILRNAIGELYERRAGMLYE